MVPKLLAALSEAKHLLEVYKDDPRAYKAIADQIEWISSTLHALAKIQ